MLTVATTPQTVMNVQPIAIVGTTRRVMLSDFVLHVLPLLAPPPPTDNQQLALHHQHLLPYTDVHHPEDIVARALIALMVKYVMALISVSVAINAVLILSVGLIKAVIQQLIRVSARPPQPIVAPMLTATANNLV